MLHVEERPVGQSALSPYVEGYGIMRIGQASVFEKPLLAWPGASWMFANQPFAMAGERFGRSSVSGIREQPINFSWQVDPLEVLAVKCAPFGLFHFTDLPVGDLVNRTLPVEEVFPDWTAVDRAKDLPVEERLRHIESFLLERLRPASPTDLLLFAFLNCIRQDPSIDLPTLRPMLPMSDRQLQRKLKRMVGVSLTTFVRICRFFHAKSKLLTTGRDRLTDHGYEAGYFDQAHFTKEFRHFASQSPKHFPAGFPVFDLLAGRAED